MSFICTYVASYYGRVTVIMVDITGAEDKFHVDKVSKWTVYFLIDLRALFIITYVYISVAHLISATANSEASTDVNSMALFNVTSHPNHSNVTVSYIDDAVLWNCREHSETKKYYQGLYSMLFSAFTATLLILTISKLAILWGNKAGISHLWKIAVVQQLQVAKKSDFTEYNCNGDQLVTAQYNLLGKYVSVCSFSEIEPIYTHNCCNMAKKFSEMQCFNCLRITTLLISVFLLPSAIFLSFISYDLHLLSCIVGPAEEYINYDPSDNTVELRYSDNILLFQKIIGFIIFVSVLILLLNAVCFYLSNSVIVDKFKPSVKETLLDDLKNGNGNEASPIDPAPVNNDGDEASPIDPAPVNNDGNEASPIDPAPVNNDGNEASPTHPGPVNDDLANTSYI